MDKFFIYRLNVALYEWIVRFSRNDVMLRHKTNKHGITHPYPQSTHVYPPPQEGNMPPPPEGVDYAATEGCRYRTVAI